jgi:hypothetical protein
MRTLLILLALISLKSNAAITAAGGMLYDSTTNLKWLNTKTLTDYNTSLSNGWRLATGSEMAQLESNIIYIEDLTQDFSLFFDNNLNARGWYSNNPWGYEINYLSLTLHNEDYYSIDGISTIGSYQLFDESFFPQTNSAFLVTTVPLPGGLVLFLSALLSLCTIRKLTNFKRG